MELKTRNEIPEQYKWDLESIFPNVEAWEAAIIQTESLCEEAAGYEGRLSEAAGTLANFLELRERLSALVGKVFVWGYLPASADTTDVAAAGRRDQAIGVSGRISAAIAFADPEIIAISSERMSPNRFSVTRTSKESGRLTSCIAALST